MLGLCMVKKIVNQDDISVYYLFYVDGLVQFGIDLIFFDWFVVWECCGMYLISCIGLCIGVDSFDFWVGWLGDCGLIVGKVVQFDGCSSFDFEDFEGQCFCLIEDVFGIIVVVWEKSLVFGQYQIYGFGLIIILVFDLVLMEIVLMYLMNMVKVCDYVSLDGQGMVYVFQMGDGGFVVELYVVVQFDLFVVCQGVGGVYYVVFCVFDKFMIYVWVQCLNDMCVFSLGEVEWYYFCLLYFCELGGNLFEIVIDKLGFVVDELLELLGESLLLLLFFEGCCDQIEVWLKLLD